MKYIKHTKYKYPHIKLYHNGTFVHLITNDVELHYVLLEIAKAQVKGYYFMWEGEEIIIDEEGCYQAPKDLYNTTFEIVCEHLRVQRAHGKKSL